MLIVSLLAQVPGSATRAESERYAEFLYMDSNIGGSSGGHLAISVQDIVYHFQYSSRSIFTLNRDRPEQFYAAYNQNENRNIEVTPLRLKSADINRIKSSLDSYHLIQQKTLRILRLFEQDEVFLSALERSEKLPVEHTGYFTGGNSCMGKETYDSQYWQKEFEEIPPHQNRIDIKPFVHTAPLLSRDSLPVTTPFYSELLSEQIQSDAFDRLVTQDHCTGPAFLETSIEIPPEGLSPLQSIYANLKQSAKSLLHSERKDRAGALLLTMARMIAIRRTLKTNHLVVLDTTPVDAESGSRVAMTQLKQFPGLIQRARAICAEVTKTRVGPDDAARHWNIIENCGTRFHEIVRTDSDVMRYYSGNLAPTGIGLVAPENATAEHVTSATAKKARDASREFKTKVKRVYAFNLVAENCSTELQNLILESLGSSDDARNALGGSLHPQITFIPALASLRMRTLKQAEDARTVISRRSSILSSKYDSNSPLMKPLIYLKESNVITSSAYSSSDEDTRFIFFTDDVIAIRPIYGVVNVAYGIVQTGYGLLKFPFDGGSRLSGGVRGVLFSLPELVFFNIRKGTYAIPTSEL